MVHSGHKDRLRQKALTNFEGLQSHEIIELLLNFSIVRKNTNALAHELMNKFGSVTNIMDASLSQLLQVEGLGEVSATLLLLVPKLCQVYNRGKCASYSKITCSAEASDYFRTLMTCLNHEECYALCLDRYDKIKCCLKIASGDEDSINVDVKTASSKICQAFPDKVYFSHNHLVDSAYPSNADVLFTNALAKELKLHNIKLMDHIVISPKEEFSLLRANCLKSNN